jgi:SAM-dependent MidA family methyltransferase
MTPDADRSTLPALTADEHAHSDAVLAVVHRALAAAGGWLGFDDYLRIVLYGPGLGYYSAGSVKFGAEGDFVTAPEISVLFSRCLARQCAEVLVATGGGSVLELGAGTGRMAAEVLSTLDAMGQLPERYYILEVSAQLRSRQFATLAALPGPLAARVEWLETLPDIPLAGVVLANEVADALPFRRFAIHSGALFERGVARSADGALVQADRAAPEALVRELGRLSPQWPPEYESELCPLQGPWIAALAATLSRGAVFIVDYGLARRDYYDPRRDHGTLRCHFRHRAHEDPLRYPGLQDISAWVDFTRLAESAVDAQLEVAGYCTQAAFLLGSGIEAMLAAPASALRQARLASEARQLLLPEEMGEHFKAIALTRGLDLRLQGFRHQDLRHSL